MRIFLFPSFREFYPFLSKISCNLAWRIPTPGNTAVCVGLKRPAAVVGSGIFPYGRAAMGDQVIYHMCRADEWQAAQATGRYAGSSQDRADGFIHFSTASQVVASAARHRAGQDGLVLLEVDVAMLGIELRWEVSRGGQLFPHLYGDLPVATVTRVTTLTLESDGRHVFPVGLG